MKKLLVLLLSVAAAVGLFFTFRPAATFTNFPPQTGKVWVAFGDSLTAGTGASQGNDYPSLLSKTLGVPILNYGVPGHTSHEALGRVEEILALEPKVVLVCFGGNDTLTSVPHAQTFENLSRIIDSFHQAGAFVVLIGIRTASVRDKYHAQFKRLAKQKNVLFVSNILSGIIGDPRLMADYVHPNDQGYAEIAQRLEQVLQPLLPSLAP